MKPNSVALERSAPSRAMRRRRRRGGFGVAGFAAARDGDEPALDGAENPPVDSGLLRALLLRRQKSLLLLLGSIGRRFRLRFRLSIARERLLGADSPSASSAASCRATAAPRENPTACTRSSSSTRIKARTSSASVRTAYGPGGGAPVRPCPLRSQRTTLNPRLWKCFAAPLSIHESALPPVGLRSSAQGASRARSRRGDSRRPGGTPRGTSRTSRPRGEGGGDGRGGRATSPPERRSGRSGRSGGGGPRTARRASPWRGRGGWRTRSRREGASPRAPPPTPPPPPPPPPRPGGAPPRVPPTANPRRRVRGARTPRTRSRARRARRARRGRPTRGEGGTKGGRRGEGASSGRRARGCGRGGGESVARPRAAGAVFPKPDRGVRGVLGPIS